MRVYINRDAMELVIEPNTTYEAFQLGEVFSQLYSSGPISHGSDGQLNIRLNDVELMGLHSSEETS